jgi:hypothetical protein
VGGGWQARSRTRKREDRREENTSAHRVGEDDKRVTGHRLGRPTVYFWPPVYFRPLVYFRLLLLFSSRVHFGPPVPLWGGGGEADKEDSATGGEVGPHLVRAGWGGGIDVVWGTGLLKWVGGAKWFK